VRHAPRWAWSVVLLAAAVVARADDAKPKDPPKDETPKSAAEQYQALLKELMAERTEYMNAIRAAKDDEERQKIFNEKYPKPQKYAPKFLELAKKNPTDSTAFEALSWLCMNVAGTAEGKEASEIILKDHVKNEKLGPIAMRLSGSGAEKTLRRIIAESPHKDVQGFATLRLAQVLKEGNKEEATKLFEQVIAKYPDVKFYDGAIGKMAKGELNELRGLLEVGKPAIEIAGEDIDGTKFKLSDYRGKVVMLDFWGHW
jgi:tetratricopeptide (TPR) repeat protein